MQKLHANARKKTHIKYDSFDDLVDDFVDDFVDNLADDLVDDFANEAVIQRKHESFNDDVCIVDVLY